MRENLDLDLAGLPSRSTTTTKTTTTSTQSVRCESTYSGCVRHLRCIHTHCSG